MISFTKFLIWETPNGIRLLLLEEKISSGDSTWLAAIVTQEKASTVPARFEKAVVMARFLRGCKFISSLDPLLVKAFSADCGESVARQSRMLRGV
jgi:hypothetical protein